MKLTLQDGNQIVNAIGFNLGHYAEDFLLGDKVDMIGMVEINEFANNRMIQINLKDIRKSY